MMMNEKKQLHPYTFLNEYVSNHNLFTAQHESFSQIKIMYYLQKKESFFII